MPRHACDAQGRANAVGRMDARERPRPNRLLERLLQARSLLLFPFSGSVDRRQRIDRGCAGEYILS